MSNGLPGYIAAAQPNPMENRAPWYKNTAPTYAGIFLWFVFWSGMPSGGSAETPGGVLAQGVLPALIGLVIAALLCHFLFYLVPGLFGMKTGLPLYVVGTSTYGAGGGLFMPGFLMGLLQFGWLGVNAYFASMALSPLFGAEPGGAVQKGIAVVWAALAAFIGIKGIQYVAKVASVLPLIPLVILVVLLVKTLGGLGQFDSAKLVAAAEGGEGRSFLGVVGLCITYVVGFFATAGAAGVDFGMNNRDEKDVQMGGLFGIALATIIAGGAAILIVAGAFGGRGEYALNPADPGFMGTIMGSAGAGKVMGLLLAIAAFPPACFSSFIAANSFKTTLPKVNPFVSVGIGAVVSILLAVTGWAGKLMQVFTVIGASFGPVCGAMLADYVLNKGKWSGPRAGWNLAGWISWVVGFVVGMAPLMGWFNVPVAPVAAFVIGAVLYVILAKAGLEPPVLAMPGGGEEAAAEAAVPADEPEASGAPDAGSADTPQG